ncbi:MAG: hypothetical protein OXG98_09810 [Gemmatimonadetes bacterium]|nr:hypothetical protein [Gemmatimonadota bacterium]
MMKTHNRLMTALILTGALSWASQAGAQLSTNAGFNPEPLSLVDFKKAFNGDTGKVRLVVMFSPT